MWSSGNVFNLVKVSGEFRVTVGTEAAFGVLVPRSGQSREVLSHSGVCVTPEIQSRHYST